MSGAQCHCLPPKGPFRINIAVGHDEIHIDWFWRSGQHLGVQAKFAVVIVTVNEQVDVYIQRCDVYIQRCDEYIQRCDVYIQKGVTGKYSYNYSRVQYVLASAILLCNCSYVGIRLQYLGCRGTYLLRTWLELTKEKLLLDINCCVN